MQVVLRQASAAVHLPGAVVIRRRLRALELWRLIGKMSFVIATRYHAMLAAFAQDVPFVVIDEYLSDLCRTFAGARTFVVLYLTKGLHQPVTVSTAVLGTVAAGYVIAASWAGRIGASAGAK